MILFEEEDESDVGESLLGMARYWADITLVMDAYGGCLWPVLHRARPRCHRVYMQ